MVIHIKAICRASWWPSTPKIDMWHGPFLKIDMVTWPFLKIDMWHGHLIDMWHGAFPKFDMWHGHFLNLTWWHGQVCKFDIWHGCLGEVRQGAFLKIDMRHGDPPVKGPTLVRALVFVSLPVSLLSPQLVCGAKTLQRVAGIIDLLAPLSPRPLAGCTRTAKFDGGLFIYVTTQ